MMKKQAFTLIELLVAITIIGILAALILPAIAKVRGKAYETTCINNLKQLYMASMMYADDHNGSLPNIPYINPTDGKGVRDALAAYIPDQAENYTCPTNPFKDIYLSLPIYGYCCYWPAYQDYNYKWETSGSRNWDSCSAHVTNGGTLFGDFVEDEIGLGRVGPSHRNKYGLQITTKGAIYFWYVITAGQSGPWAEYPSGKDVPLK